MMVLKIHFTPDEVSRFFTQNGYKVEPRKFGHYVNAYHNKSEWIEYTDDAVVDTNGSYAKASLLFEKVIEQRVKRMIAPQNLECKRAIKAHFKKITNG